MSESLFTKIIKGEVPSNKVYEDDEFIAILDIFPVNPGHTLLIPKLEKQSLTDLPQETLGNMMKLVPVIAQSVMKATQAPSFNLIVNDGPVAGQVIPHVHLHIIPRQKNDGYKAWHGDHKLDDDKMTEIANAIRKNLQ